MQSLYDSDKFAVIHVIANAPENKNELMTVSPRHGFEIVDKMTNKEVYLDGSWASAFQIHISNWQVSTPSQDEVEEVLSSYCELAQLPLYQH